MDSLYFSNKHTHYYTLNLFFDSHRMKQVALPNPIKTNIRNNARMMNLIQLHNLMILSAFSLFIFSIMYLVLLLQK